MKSLLKALFLAISAIIISMQMSFAQTVVLDRHYDLSNSDMIYDQVLLSDGGLMMTGYTTNLQGVTNILVMRTDNMGEPVWIRNFGGDSTGLAKRIIPTIDGNFMVAGELGIAGFLLKISPGGDSLWSKSFPDTNRSGFKDIQQTVNGDYVVIEWIYLLPLSSKLLMIDETGEITYESEIEGAECHTLKTIGDDAFVLSGWLGDILSPTFFLRKYQFDGTLLFAHEYDGFHGMTRCMEAVNSGYYIGGFKGGISNVDGIILKTGNEGTEDWTFSSPELVNTIIEAMATDEFENVFFTIRQIWVDQLLLMELKPNRNEVAHFEYPMSLVFIGNMITDNEFLYVTGNYQDGIANHGFLLKLVVDSIMTGVNEQQNHQVKEVNIYPNPAERQVNIESDSKIHSISLYNSFGRNVYDEEVNEKITQLNISGIEPGFYFINIQNGSGSFTRKILKR